ncbi:MAG: clostripain-related cysteine peptidase [Elusimicrobia bacterium]|nr:clostripain-related cysteine peptidase [Elusimicrobiota bacterium]
MKDWTIMVFMNGKNSLSEYVPKDMNEMEKYGPTENINIVTQSARMKEADPYYPPGGGGYDDYPWGGGPVVPHPGWPNPGWPSLPPMMMKDASVTRDASTDWIGVRRYLITADGDNAALSSTLLSDMGTVDMGDYKQLVEFGKWAKQNYPAKKYMLIVWNHGDGWKTRSLHGETVLKGISYDDETGNGITTVQLGTAVREMGGVDIYASDACLMQMAEVAYELKDAARITVGSEENEPGDGWAYDYFLSRVHSNKTNLTPEVMAAAAVQGYKAFYGEKGTSATQSALKTSGMGGFRSVMDQWVPLAMKEDKVMLKDALNGATSFGGAGSRDLMHFMELVHGSAKSEELKTKTAGVMKYFYDNVWLDNGATGAGFEKAYGMGAYLPSYGYEKAYGNLAWSKDGQWDEFVQWLTAK